MKPFFTYYGGKHRLAAKYPNPKHKKVVEPFAGSAGYATRYFDRDVILIDADERVCGVWDYIISSSPSEILSLPYILENESVDDFNICQEAKWLIGFWLNKGAAQPCKKPSTWMKSGLRPNSYWGYAVRNRIASQCDSVSHWRIIHGSYLDFDLGEATYFIDPPYQNMGVHYRHGAKGFDFATLADWCKSRKGQTIVCENTGADWLPFRHFVDAKASESKTGGKVSKEAVWISDEV